MLSSMSICSAAAFSCFVHASPILDSYCYNGPTATTMEKLKGFGELPDAHNGSWSKRFSGCAGRC